MAARTRTGILLNRSADQPTGGHQQMPCATQHPPTATPPAVNAQTAAAGSSPAAPTASPSLNGSATAAPDPITTHRERAYRAVVDTGLHSAQLYDLLSPWCSHPFSPLDLDQIAAYLDLAQQMHRYSAEAIAALVELQAEVFNRNSIPNRRIDQ